MKCPCFKCEERNEKCHASCEKYKAWTDDRKKLLDAKAKDKAERDEIWDYRKKKPLRTNCTMYGKSHKAKRNGKDYL